MENDQFEVGDIVTTDWARYSPREDAPLFLILNKVESNQCHTHGNYKVYCYYSNSNNNNTKGWLGNVFKMPGEKLIKINFEK